MALSCYLADTKGIQGGGHHSSLVHGFNQSPPGFQALGPVALLNDGTCRLSHVVVHHREINKHTHSPTLMSCEATGIQARHYIVSDSFSFQCNQDAVDNFEVVDLSWVKCAMDPLKVLGHGLEFLEDPSKINSNNHASCGAIFTLLLPSGAS